MKDIRRKIAKQEKEWLVDRLVELAIADDTVADRIIRALHIDACQKLGPDPSVLAVRLAELGQQTEWGFFDGPPDGYVEILGQDGIKTFVASLSIASKSRSKSNK